MKPYFGLRGKSLNYAVGLIAGCDFLLFGYGKIYGYASLVAVDIDQVAV